MEFDQYKNKGKEILGYMPLKTPCVTCLTPDEEIPIKAKLPRRKCLIRQCVDKTGVANCAYCSRFPCDTLEGTAGLWNRVSIEAKLGMPLSDDEYHTFVQPFEGLNRLQAIRTSLQPDEIIDPAKASSTTRTIGFPNHLFLQEERVSFKLVHDLLVTIENSALGLNDTDTFAQQHTLNTRKSHLLRFLWILGAYGQIEKENTTHLAVDAETYLAHRGTEKTLASWPFVEDVVFKMLAEFGVKSQRIALKGITEEELITGTGYLRKNGWRMALWFKEERDHSTLNALHKYATELKRRYGSKAFQRFQRADMREM
jgi:hypothetical protein